MSVILDKALELGEFSGFRSLYPVRYNGELIAFVGYPNGWGKAWVLHKLQLVSDPRISKSVPQVEGCLPVMRTEGTQRLYAKDGRAQAIHYLSQSENRERFPTRAQLIEKQSKVIETMITNTSAQLGNAVAHHYDKGLQHSTLKDLLDKPSLLTGSRRMVMLKLLSQLSDEALAAANRIESLKNDIAGYQKAASEATDATPGITLGQLSGAA